MFFNYLTMKNETEAVKRINDRWYIDLGFAGFNSRANNYHGYKTKDAAEAAIRKYEKMS